MGRVYIVEPVDSECSAERTSEIIGMERMPDMRGTMFLADEEWEETK